MHVLGPANACAFVHRLSTRAETYTVQMDRQTFCPAAMLDGARSGSPNHNNALGWF